MGRGRPGGVGVVEAAGAEEAVAVADGSAGLGRGRSETGTRIGGSRAGVPYTAHPPLSNGRIAACAARAPDVKLTFLR